LTAKEMAVLECLMREPERVLTRTQIAEHVWNYDVFNHSTSWTSTSAICAPSSTTAPGSN